MEEAYVRLLCPECKKDWESTPRDLPGHADLFHCPNCHASRRLAEFMRTDHDLQTLKELS
jgi:hydrogenase maturation factor HypF (carbamoyltransferase family)